MTVVAEPFSTAADDAGRKGHAPGGGSAGMQVFSRIDGRYDAAGILLITDKEQIL